MKKNRDIIPGILLLVLGLSILFFLFTAALRSIKQISYSDSDVKIATLKQQKQSIERIKKDHSEYQNFGEIYEAFKQEWMIPYRSFSEFRNQFQLLMTQFNIPVSNFSPKPRELLNEYIMFSFSVKLRGDYRQQKRFINAIRKWDKMIYIVSINFNKTENQVVGKYSLEVCFAK